MKSYALIHVPANTIPVSDRLSILHDRAAMLSSVRAFFAQRNVLEVDCPLITAAASIDAFIDLIPAEERFLHSSPEYGMKRLLSEGIGDIFQLSHVFRKGEIGSRHNPEFMMAEWYRIGFSFRQMIEETVDFIRLFLGDLEQESITYQEAFLKYAGVDFRTLDEESQFRILIEKIEPNLGIGKICALTHYPAEQCALAQIADGFAERFEIYCNGMELANGYHELTNAGEQRVRFEEANKKRISMGNLSLPLDEHFLKALETGLPDCCGVAVGFDRLMMLRHGKQNIREVIPFSWDAA